MANVQAQTIIDDLDRTDLIRADLELEEQLRQIEADAKGLRVVFTEIEQDDGLWTLRIRYEFIAMELGAVPIAPDFSLPPAPVGPAPISPAPVAPASVSGALPPIVEGSTLAQLAEDYRLCWAACRINPEKQSDVTAGTRLLLKGRARYEAVGDQTDTPWPLIGTMHGLECGYSFDKHLHNGDSLSAPTHQVPSGRPSPDWRSPPGTWEQSAIDAVRLKFKGITDWGVPQMLYALEGFNGFGYRPRRIRSPYLWSFSNLYTKGRFVADHQFDPESVSKQVGSALILKMLEQQALLPVKAGPA